MRNAVDRHMKYVGLSLVVNSLIKVAVSNMNALNVESLLKKFHYR